MAQQSYLGDPMLDRVMHIVMNLAEELYVTRDRLAVIEALLESKGTVRRDEIEHFEPTEEFTAGLKAFREKLVERLLEPAARPTLDP